MAERRTARRTRSKGAEGRPTPRTLPPGVTELTSAFGQDGGIVELKDGALMLAQGGGIVETGFDRPTFRISKDGGKRWSRPRPLDCEIGVGGMIRLQSGKLAIYGARGEEVHFCWSDDEGRTWTKPVRIPVYRDFRPMFHSMIQLSSGRLLLTGYWESDKHNASHPDLEAVTATRWGLWRGRVLFMEGHRGVEMGICQVYYSDDEGASWKQCKGGLMGWFSSEGVPDGTMGITDVYEPTAAETKDGRVLLFARCKRGRLVQSYSRDGGETWYSMQPTELASSQSPPLLIRIPTTGDLLCVWNQVSGEEIRRGYLRGRLSAAVSEDSGLSWGHFKTIEVQEGMEDVDRVIPEYPIPAIVRGRFGLGQLADGFAMFTYPNVDIVGESAFIRYGRMWPVKRKPKPPDASEAHLPLMWPTFGPLYQKREAEMRGESVMRRYPLKWFYD